MTIPELEIDDGDCKYGTYIEREVFIFTNDFEARWDHWLYENQDIGHYDSWKDRARLWSDYIDGHPKRWAQTFLPAIMVREIINSLRLY